jgi:hypothetical protein
LRELTTSPTITMRSGGGGAAMAAIAAAQSASKGELLDKHTLLPRLAGLVISLLSTDRAGPPERRRPGGLMQKQRRRVELSPATSVRTAMSDQRTEKSRETF